MSAFEFEGQEVVDFHGVLPKAMLECPEAYTRGTLLSLNVEVRVKSVRLEEDRQGNLIRQHVFAIDAVTIKDKIDPQAVLQGAVTGSASSTAEPEIALHEDTDCWCGADKHVANEPPEIDYTGLDSEPVDYVPA